MVRSAIVRRIAGFGQLRLIDPQLLTQRQFLEDERAGPAAKQNHDLNSRHQPGDHRPT
jgi:hypothetical protein